MKQRIILITGGTGKLGRAFVRHFLDKGDKVVVTSRHQSSLDKLLVEHREYKDYITGFSVEFTEHNAIGRLLTLLSQHNIYPDCLVNNARCLDFLKIEENGLVSRSNFTNELLVDVVVPYELTMGLALIKDSQLRRVVNIGSQYGLVAANKNLYLDFHTQSPLHYGVAKAALTHLTKELAVRLADRNVQINCVAFGGVRGRVDKAFEERYATLCPMGRMLDESEIAQPVDMLLSDACSAVTGHTMVVDGGWSIW